MNKEMVEQFLQECINYIGMGFHIDTDFNDYIDFRNRQRLYSKAEADKYNIMMEEAINYCIDNDIDIYELAMKYF